MGAIESVDLESSDSFALLVFIPNYLIPEAVTFCTNRKLEANRCDVRASMVSTSLTVVSNLLIQNHAVFKL